MARKDWKKQLFRVKQIADQNLGRVEKTEALTSDLQVLEKRVEQYGKIFSSTGKKLLSCLQGQPGQDVEKRQKKLPEYAFANNLIEGSSHLGIDTLVGQVFQICGDAEGHVANKTLQHELNVENRVLAPIHNLIDNDIPAIQKHKKNLQRVVLDMDSAKTRYASALKEQTKGSNNPGSAKVDSLRDEYEEACYRVDQCRDQLATEMFTLASREAELSSILLELVRCQATYHKQCLETLERRIPQIEEQIEFHTHMPVYGKPMDDHLRRTNRTIALVIEECIRNLISLGGMEEEGLFRIAGAANKVKKLKAAFNSEQCSDIAEEYDVHCIAGALKQYLRELPDPLMTSALYPDWMQAAHLPADQRLAALAEVVARIPKLNYENLRFLIKFLCKLAEYQEVNKMSPSNIAIVMGPNLIWPEGESGPSVLTTSTQSAIVEALITHSDYFFPGDEDLLDQIVNNNNLQGQASQPDLLNSMPQGAGSGYHTLPPTQHGKGPDMIPGHGHATSSHGTQGHLPAQSLIGSLHSSPTSPTGSQENMSASTSSLDMLDAYVGSRSGGASPKPPRRVNKKPAPMPPTERPLGPAPLPPVMSPLVADKPPLGPSSMSVPGPGPPVMSPPITDKPLSAGAHPGANLPYPVKPPLPGRPTAAPSDQPYSPQAAPRPERPPSPTRRPSAPPPERPQPAERPAKPDKPSGPPGEKLYPSLSPATLNTSPQSKKSSSSVSSGDHSPPQSAKMILNAVFDTAEKPPLPPPPAIKPDTTVHTPPHDEMVLGHKRQGSSGGRPPRPQPPPPPNKPSSVSQDVDDIDQSSSANILNAVPPSPGPEQTYL